MTLLPWIFPTLAGFACIGIPALAWARRGRMYAIFTGIALGISMPGLLVSYFRLDAWLSDGPVATRAALEVAFTYGIVALLLHMASMVRARLRPVAVRALVNGPGQTFLAAGVLAGAWLLLLLPLRLLLLAVGAEDVLDLLRGFDLVPFVLVIGFALSSPRLRRETVEIRLGARGPEVVTRVAVRRRRGLGKSRPGILRVAQVSDPHLGPWQSIGSLQRTLDDLLAHEPDLVLLTGDYLTMEGNGTPGALAESLRPLKQVPGRCFAILGNHDHEAPDEVRAGFEANGVPLLVDDETTVETAVGPVQILGADYVRKDRAAHLERLCERFPRRADHLRLLLLHDPQGFDSVPDGDADLVLSGHTHGGQVGLVSFGFNWTVLSGSRWPDHGLFAKGCNRLYVHRGTGFYGFPLRMGVPGEASILEVSRPES